MYMLYTYPMLRKGLFKILRGHEAANFFKELGLQTSYFWGGNLKNNLLFPGRRETIYLF